ncbi:MAG: multidrug effflux MFS transporter [Gammaproteobacteria bacterium]|nr:multidrug effflux MFS transporter [Gammaproteobacteria bacterium]
MILNKKWALFTVLFSIPLGGIGIDLYTPAMPAMVEAFHTIPAEVKLTIGAFLLGAAISQLFLSPLSDTYGRKNLKLLGALLFTLASIGIVWVPNIEWVIVLRILQGIGVGAITSLARAKVTDVFEKHEMRIISSYIAISWALGPIIAPWIGGYIQHYLGWEYCFYFLAFYGALTILINALLVPETIKVKIPFSLKKIMLNYKAIIFNGYFIGILLCMGLCYSILIVFALIGPFLLQTVMGYSSIIYGYIALIMGVGYFSGTLLGRALHAFQERKLILMALCAISFNIAIGLVLTVIAPHSLLAFCLPIILVCGGVGILFPIFLGRSLSLFPHMAGTAAALTGFGNIIIASLVTFFISFIVITKTIQAVLLYGLVVLLLWLVLFCIMRKNL